MTCTFIAPSFPAIRSAGSRKWSTLIGVLIGYNKSFPNPAEHFGEANGQLWEDKLRWDPNVPAKPFTVTTFCCPCR